MKIKSIIGIVLLALLTIETYIIIRQVDIIRSIKKEVPFLIKGEQIDYFDLLNVEGTVIDNFTLEKNPHSLVFIFEQPCSECTKNIVYWKKIKNLVKEKIPVYGIVLEDYDETLNFYHSVKLNFNLFFPENKQKFLDRLRIKYNFAQTILLKRNRVDQVKIGNLSSEDFLDVIKILRTQIREMI